MVNAITELERLAAVKKILGLLAKPKGFEELIRESGHSRGYTNKILQQLAKEKKASKITVEGRQAWVITERGAYFMKQSLTALAENISDIIEKGGSYFTISDPDHLSSIEYIKSPPPLSMYNAKYPSSIDNSMNTIKMQSDMKDVLVKELIKELSNSGLDNLPEDSKMILSFEVDLHKYLKFINELRLFMNKIKNNSNVFLDEKLGLKGHEIEKLSLFESYLNNADGIEDKKYKDRLEALLQQEEFVKELITFGTWSSFLDIDTLKEVEKIFRSGKDPLDKKELVGKLIIKVPEGGFYVPLYDYLLLVKILNHYDRRLVEKVRGYEFTNKITINKSKVFAMQNKMREKDGR
jgi:CTP-dependent riboflavin kinase